MKTQPLSGGTFIIFMGVCFFSLDLKWVNAVKPLSEINALICESPLWNHPHIIIELHYTVNWKWTENDTNQFFSLTGKAAVQSHYEWNYCMSLNQKKKVCQVVTNAVRDDPETKTVTVNYSVFNAFSQIRGFAIITYDGKIIQNITLITKGEQKKICC